MIYDNLLDYSDFCGVQVKEHHQFSGRHFKGLYILGDILLSKKIKTTTEKACVLAEELGHYHKTAGNILDQTKTENRKQELVARAWAYDKLVGLEGLIHAYHAGCENIHEGAEVLEVTENFLKEAIEYYVARYGIGVTFKGHNIRFEPLRVESIDDETQISQIDKGITA